MRKIRKIILHCSATPRGRFHNAKDIDRWHRQRGFRMIGYHYVILLDGTIERGRPITEPGAHVQGHNADSIGICYIGGVSADDINIAEDTRTPEQLKAMRELVLELTERFPDAEVIGHRDIPGVRKACPCFDTRSWWAAVKDHDASPEATSRTYTVKRGDTLFSISRQFNVSLMDLAVHNNLVEIKTNISPGDVLNIPNKV